jgi:hypothetical protein
MFKDQWMVSPSGRGGLPPRPVNAPSAPTTPAVAAGLSGQVVRANKIIISGPGEGQWVYDGAPALGNLVETTGQTGVGTDQYGNATLAGATTYINSGAGFFATSLNGGGVSFWFAATAAGPYSLTAQLFVSSTGFLNINLVGDTVAGVIPQSSAAVTTVAQLVAVLKLTGILD